LQGGLDAPGKTGLEHSDILRGEGTARKSRLLAGRTPTGGSPAYGPPEKSLLTAWTFPAIRPAVQKKPGTGWIRPVPTDDPDGFPGNFPDFSVHFHEPGPVDRTRAGAGIEACLPENFIRHPVADAGKKFLQQKQGLQGGVTTPAAHSRKAAEGEVPGQNPRGKGAPPRGRLRRAGEANPTEESRILKHQSSSAGVEDQVVVFPGRMLRTFRQQFSRHAEVNSQPTLSAETEKHLFAVRLA